METKSKKTKIIAEIALTHNGNFNKAINLISKCKDAGADYVKLQTHFAKFIQRIVTCGDTLRNLSSNTLITKFK